jgi:hypothetical protein
MFGVAIAVVYLLELSRLWLLLSAIAINVIVALVRVYMPDGSRYRRSALSPIAPGQDPGDRGAGA